MTKILWFLGLKPSSGGCRPAYERSTTNSDSDAQRLCTEVQASVKAWRVLRLYKQRVTSAPERAIPRLEPLARIVDSNRFQLFISAVIVLNAIVLGIETYVVTDSPTFTLLMRLNDVFYIIFLIELITRIISYFPRPLNFFRSGWNVFDFIIIGAALIPAVRAQAEILRLLRLARVVRLLRFLPDARMLMATLAKALPSIVLVILIIFVYGMIGVFLFGEELPQEWGNIGAAMLTLFILLTLENFPTYLEQAQTVTPFAPVFFLSYVLIAAFVVLNLVLGIVVGAMEEAREEERARLRKEEETEHTSLVDLVLGLRNQLTLVEQELQELNRKPGSLR
jgi:voltage-gated sodium channel